MKKFFKRAFITLLVCVVFMTGINISVTRALDTQENVTLAPSDEDLKMLASKYVDLLSQGNIPESMSLLSNQFREIIKPNVLDELILEATFLKSLSVENININRDQVHQNVVIRYIIGGQKVEFIIRFNHEGQIDDCMISLVYPIEYKAPQYDNNENYIEKEVAIGEGQWKLSGVLTIPKGEGPFPVVILSHGSGPHDRDETAFGNKPFRDLAVGLASKNIAVLRYNKRTFEYGETSQCIDNIGINYDTIDDDIAAINFLNTITEDIDKSKIFILGHSQSGGLIPKIINSDRNGIINGAIIMSGNSRNLLDLMLEQNKYLMGLGFSTKEQYDANKDQIDIIKNPEFDPQNPPNNYSMGNAYFWNDAKNYNLTEELSKVTMPLLILQGERDYQVTAKEDFEGWKNLLSGRDNVEFKLYAKLNHLYTEGEGDGLSTPMEYYSQGNIPYYVIEDIASWINNLNKQ